jgi:hypothetical protein
MRGGHAVPYNMWFVTPAEQSRPAEEWIKYVAKFRNDLRTELVRGKPQDWRVITVKDANDGWWFNFERYSVASDDEKWRGDLDFFRSWLAVGKPEVNARWVEEYLTRVRTVYMFRCSTSAPETNMDLVNDIVRGLHDDCPGGLLYAELEGWINDLDAHITWEFSEQVTGACLMAIRRPAGWVYFWMELGAPQDREAFKAGEVPAGLETKEYRD